MDGARIEFGSSIPCHFRSNRMGMMISVRKGHQRKRHGSCSHAKTLCYALLIVKPKVKLEAKSHISKAFSKAFSASIPISLNVSLPGVKIESKLSRNIYKQRLAQLAWVLKATIMSLKGQKVLTQWPSRLHISSWLSNMKKVFVDVPEYRYLDAFWKERYLDYMKHKRIKVKGNCRLIQLCHISSSITFLILQIRLFLIFEDSNGS
ncbi:hypothetical protein VNO77_25384 [Canavalia gladiata]|uniref:Uncharacterized protein n=1 Tax=Canavalia gladiata TaxID=3824 RepID=A0AAN9L806_CANGL